MEWSRPFTLHWVMHLASLLGWARQCIRHNGQGNLVQDANPILWIASVHLCACWSFCTSCNLEWLGNLLYIPFGRWGCRRIVWQLISGGSWSRDTKWPNPVPESQQIIYCSRVLWAARLPSKHGRYTHHVEFNERNEQFSKMPLGYLSCIWAKVWSGCWELKSVCGWHEQHGAFAVALETGFRCHLCLSTQRTWYNTLNNALSIETLVLDVGWHKNKPTKVKFNWLSYIFLLPDFIVCKLLIINLWDCLLWGAKEPGRTSFRADNALVTQMY